MDLNVNSISLGYWIKLLVIFNSTFYAIRLSAKFISYTVFVCSHPYHFIVFENRIFVSCNTIFDIVYDIFVSVCPNKEVIENVRTHVNTYEDSIRYHNEMIQMAAIKDSIANSLFKEANEIKKKINQNKIGYKRIPCFDKIRRNELRIVFDSARACLCGTGQNDVSIFFYQDRRIYGSFRNWSQFGFCCWNILRCVAD